jgi:hypothetical protein
VDILRRLTSKDNGTRRGVGGTIGPYCPATAFLGCMDKTVSAVGAIEHRLLRFPFEAQISLFAANPRSFCDLR